MRCEGEGAVRFLFRVVFGDRFQYGGYNMGMTARGTNTSHAI